jgi:hypothetical protein
LKRRAPLAVPVPALILLLALAAAVPARPAAAAPPAVTLEPEAVLVSGLPPGGQALIFGVAREIRENVSTVVRRDVVLTDDDRDGAVRLDLGTGLPPAALWVAVELASGRYALALPPESPFVQVSLPREAFRVRSPGEPDLLAAQRSYVEELVVRPGRGAWGRAAGNGGAGDADGASDGEILSPLDGLTALGASPAAPQKLTDGDLVVIVDPNRMEFALAEFAARGL